MSVTNPCIVRLDPTTLTLSSASDYWFVAFFTARDSNNSSLAGAVSAFPNPSITGVYDGHDDTQLTTGESVPSGHNGNSYFRRHERLVEHKKEETKL